MNELKRLLTEGNFQLYDMKNQSPCEEVRNEINPIKKMLMYMQDYDRSKFDCDSCKLVKEIYKLIWKSDVDKVKYVQGDTMNSFWTTYRKALIIFYPEIFRGKKNLNRKCADELLKDFDKYKEINENKEMCKFALLTHTTGNFILVPMKYNKGRYSSTQDYWDLTLLQIRNDKLKDISKWSEKLDASENDILSWLGGNYNDSSEELFISMVKKFYMENIYINDKKEIVYLFDNHSVHHKLPQNKEEVLTCVKNMNSCIENRGSIITEKLKRLIRE